MIYSFGDCDLDERRFELRRSGSRVELQPKVLELLFYLMQRPDEVVSKSELLEALWPGVAIGESSLTRVVSLARRAIGDQAGRDSVIQTVPRRGYRLAAPVTRSRGDSVSARAIERKLAAILSADVVGYSRLMGEDEESTVRTLTAHRDRIGELVRQYRGRVVDFRGDDFLAELPSALEAVSCAVEIQEVLGNANAALPPERKMQFRIGVHLGDLRVEGERIYGDGINIASRLEGLAEPGGICISGMVYELVANRLDLGYEDLGEQEVKNIAEPVRVYRLRSAGAAAASQGHVIGTDRAPGTGVSARSAIAVLPFVNLSGDPGQEYFSDGIAEDLIIRLTYFRWFPVVARNSSFAYKGVAVDVKQVGRELGVGYVVEGSVRRAGDRVRINAQLIDATTGHHVWAHRYDRELRDVFALQDEISEAIVASIEPELWSSEGERAARRPAQNLDAWNCTQRGWWHLSQSTRQDGARARALCERALELDPQLAHAFYDLATAPHGEILLLWTETPTLRLEEAVQAAREPGALEAGDPQVQLALAAAHAITGQADQMTAALELAIRLNPGSSMAYRWLGLLFTSATGGEEVLAKLSLDRRPPARESLARVFRYGVAMVHFAAERYEDAVLWAKAAPRERDWFIACGLHAASCAHLGRADEARELLDEAVRLRPEFSLAPLKALLSSAHPGFVERLDRGLRMLGWTQ